jgi:hypothetical protein
MTRDRFRKIWITLFLLLALVYVLAKMNFFTMYFRTATTEYVQQHSVYWVAMAVIAAAMWLVEKRFER